MLNRPSKPSRVWLLLFCSALSFSAFSPISADVLLIDNVYQAPANNSQGIPRPVRGMAMKDVENQFGSPVGKNTRVGTPPITRWEYDKFSVYFEHNHVLHSVVHRSKTP